MTTETRESKLRDKIAGKLQAEGATDLSDDQLNRCLGECVSGPRLIRYAQEFRDSGYLVLSGVGRTRQ